MEKNIWTYWNEKWNRTIDIARKNDWVYQDIEILPSISSTEIDSLEKEIGVTYPSDFRNILTTYSAGVFFGWQIKDQEFTKDFKAIFSGSGGVYYQSEKAFIWNFKELKRIHTDYISWIENCYDDPLDSYGKHYYNKIPFLDVPNGDLIVFNDKGNVIYLSHDDGPLHGEKLADNFVEFITNWSSFACVGPESEQLQVFYDKENKKLFAQGEIIEKWIAQMENK